MAERVLLLEDDRELGGQIVQHLEKAGLEVSWWKEGRHLQPHDVSQVSLVILDLMLPGIYGMDILKALRTFSEVPVLILSARNDNSDKVRGLKVGADDYLTKPFWPDELVERVRARLRRPVMQKAETLLRVGPLELNIEGRSVKAEGAAVELTRVEFDLLVALARRAGSAVTRQWLVEHVLDAERDGTERTLDVHVSRLRKKLGSANAIETVWGIGYRLAEENPS